MISRLSNSLFIFLLLLMSCGGAPAITAPVAQPFTPIDLEPLLIQSGDLPPGVSGAQVRDTAPKMFDGMPKATKAVYQQFAVSGKQVGGVAVFLYEQDADRDAGYALLLKGMGAIQPSDVGDKAVSTSITVASETISDLLFLRCHAVVQIRMNGDSVNATAYAKRLDARLQKAVC